MFALTVPEASSIDTKGAHDQNKGLTMTYTTSQVSARPLGGGVAALVRTLGTALARRRMYQRTVRELNSLTPRELSDLGIHPAMIHQIAAEAAYGN